MGQSLAGGQTQRGAVDVTLKQHHKAIHSPPRLVQMLEQRVEIRLVALQQLAESGVQAHEGRFVGGQHQQALGQAFAQTGAAAQPVF